MIELAAELQESYHRQLQGCFLSALWPTQPPSELAQSLFQRGQKLSDLESEHQTQSNAEVKYVWSFTSTLPCASYDVVFKHTDKLYL